jgi:hypothetical protein
MKTPYRALEDLVDALDFMEHTRNIETLARAYHEPDVQAAAERAVSNAGEKLADALKTAREVLTLPEH